MWTEAEVETLALPQTRLLGCPLLLEGLVVERIQPVLYGFVQLPQGEKLLIPQRRQDPCGNDTDGALYKGFILGLARPCGDDGCSVILRHLLICLLDDSFAAGILDDACFEIVRSEDPGSTAKEMGGRTAPLFGF